MNSSEFDVLLRYVRHDTNEMTPAMAVVAAGGIREGAKVLTGIYAALKNGGFVVGGLGHNQK